MTITANPSVRQVLAQVVQDPEYAKVARKPVVSWPHIGLVALAYGIATAWYLWRFIDLRQSAAAKRQSNGAVTG